MVAVAMLLSLPSACLHPSDLGALVPPTVDQDPRLPQISVEVAGHTRGLHLETFGSPDDPTVLVLHGSGADYRAWQFLLPLADRYHLVLWDQRGAGLSERITAEEISWTASIAEVDALVERYSPEAPVWLVGHSWGAMIAALYLSARPAQVQGMVLVEPGPLNGEVMTQTFTTFFSLDLTEQNLNEQQWASGFLGPADHARLDHAYLMTLQGSLLQYHCDPDHPPAWPVWRPGAYLEAIRQKNTRGDSLSSFDYDFAVGLDALDELPVLLIGTSCSAIGTDFQEEWHLPLLPPETTLYAIEEAGHRVLVEQPEALLEAIGGFLDAHPP